jgi:ATP-dependent Clp protease ATP-binding subunit ClpB
MNTQRLTIKSQELISAMQALAGDHGHQEIRDLHLLAAMLAQPEALIHPLLAKLEIPETELAAALSQALNRLPRVSGAQAYAAQEILDILHAAEKEADRLGDDYISGEHILLGILDKGKEAAKILKSMGLTADRLLIALKSYAEISG